MAPTNPSEVARDPTDAPASQRRRTTLLLALAATALGLVQLLALAPWMGEDEPWHLEYARHVGAGYRPWGGEPMRGSSKVEDDDRALMPLSQLQVRRRFAGIPAERLASTQEEILSSMARQHYYERVDWANVEPERTNFDQVAYAFSAALQPPLYYLVGGGLLSLLPSTGVEVQLWALRALSLLLYVASAVVVLGFARCIFRDERLALCTAALVAFLPMSARQAAVVNNDVLAKFLVALVLLIVARWLAGTARRWEPALALVLCGLGLLTDTTAAVGIIALLAVPFLRSRRLARRGRELAFAATLLVVASAVGYLWSTQHSPALPRSVGDVVTRLQAGLSWDSITTIGRTFVGSFGWESRFLPDGVTLCVLGLVGLGVLLSVRSLLIVSSGVSRPLLVLCLLVLGAQLAMLALRGETRGRYLMPALPALAALVVAGLLAGRSEAVRQRAAVVLLLGLVALEAIFLWGGLLVQEHLRWSV